MEAFMTALIIIALTSLLVLLGLDAPGQCLSRWPGPGSQFPR